MLRGPLHMRMVPLLTISTISIQTNHRAHLYTRLPLSLWAIKTLLLVLCTLPHEITNQARYR